MNGTAVWLNMVSSSIADKTGSKTVTPKSIKHEKGRVSVSLTDQGNG